MDTHTFVWVVDDSERMAPATKELISAARRVWVSLVALWEIVIKESTSRPMLGVADAHGWFLRTMSDTGFDLMNISPRHIGAVQGLPLHHGDPFDRLLVAQATVENVPVVTADAALARYDIKVIWAS